MKKLVIGLLLIGEISFGAQLEDIKILNVIPRGDGFELTLQTKDGPKDSYFYVEISKADSDSFDRLGQIVKKLSQPDKYKLNLEILSFSASPSGSYYRGERVIFYEVLDRAPNSTKKKSNKK